MNTFKIVYSTLSLAASVLFVIGGCAGDTPTEPTPEPPGKAKTVEITASIANHTGDVESLSPFGKDDALGVYVVNYSGSAPGQLVRSGNQSDNGRFTYDGDAWSPGGTYRWKDDTTPADVYAYYPRMTSISSVDALAFSVKANQSTMRYGTTLSTYETSDFLWGKASAVPAGTKANLVMKHVMSKIAVRIVPASGTTQGALDELTKQVSVEGLKTGASIDLRTGTATVAAGSATSVITPYEDENDVFKAIVVPQAIAAETEWIVVQVGEKTLRYDQPTTLQGGMQYNITVSAAVDGESVTLAIQSVSASKWEEDGFIHDGTSDDPGTSSEAPAFPGAEGFAAFVSGGRGGKVVYVTNLNDSGPGSFRAAVEDKTSSDQPRIVMFKVAGTIDLASDVTIERSNITIAGQSAPGGGICLRYYQCVVKGHNVIIRHMRFRSGETAKKEQMSLRLASCHDVMIDHCSATWAVDECLTSSGMYNVTIQNTIIGEGLNNAGVHPKGDHSMGSLLNSKGGVSIIHSMYTTNNTRNPRAYNMVLDYRNCVVYNWGGTLAYTSEHCAMVNMVDNYLLPGPATSSNGAKRIFKVGNLQTRLYISGNHMINRLPDNNENTSISGANNKNGVIADAWIDDLTITQNDIDTKVLVNTPFPAPALQNWKNPKTELFEYVMNNVGATLPKRDAADARIVSNARNRTGKIIDVVIPDGDKEAIGGWPDLEPGTAPADSDGDGMPDTWEDQNGFDRNNASDGAMDHDGDGYTNLEEYLNSTNPKVKEPAHGLKKSDVVKLCDDAVTAVATLKAEYEAAMNDIKWANEALVTRRITELNGKFTFEPALSTKPARVTVKLNGVEFMHMVRIPKGTFLMGMSDYELAQGNANLPYGSWDNERPQQQVTLTKDFYMSEVPTTNKQFNTLMDKSGGDAKPHGSTFTEGKQMGRLLSGATGQRFRLPTEAEWEYACRAGTTTAFSFGNTITSNQVNFDASSASVFNPLGVNRDQSVDPYTLPKNAWGLYGMHGNGYEYCEDKEGRKYTSTPVTDPVHKPVNYGNTGFPTSSYDSAEYEPNKNGTHIIRGGADNSSAMYCRSAARYEYKDGVTFGSRLVLIVND